MCAVGRKVGFGRVVGTTRSSERRKRNEGFDAARYMGTWHEIARLPKWFERDLARDKGLPSERRDMLVKMASDWGFDVSKLEYPK